MIWMNNSRKKGRFKGSFLKQDKVFTPRYVVNLLIVHELDACSRDLNDVFTLKSGLFGAVKLIKNAGLDK